MDNHWIALYLSGQYPGKYIVPNRLDIIFKIRQIDSTNFGDTIIGLLQGKSDVEYFKTLLDTYEGSHGKDKLLELLGKLGVPEDTRNDPYKKTEECCSLVDLSDHLDTIGEANFSRFIIMPILHAMGYKEIEYKGEVYESDFGLDYYVMKFTSPGGVEHYTGIQTKSKKMTNGSSKGSELFKLISETQAAFTTEHTSTDGKKHYISEYIIFNSAESPESAIKTYFESKDTQNKNIKYYGKDGILSLVKQLKLEKNFYK